MTTVTHGKGHHEGSAPLFPVVELPLAQSQTRASETIQNKPRSTTLHDDSEAAPPLLNEAVGPIRSNFRTFTILFALYLTLFVAALDQTIVATAVPTITSSLASASGYTWIGGAYLIANAAAGPIWTKLSDIWGRKPLLLCACAWFFLSSIICAKAVSMRMLIVGRAFQGVGGGGLMQLVMITISDMFSMRRRSLWLGCLEVTWAIAGGLGPVLGGVFAQEVSWRWIFWVNLPISGSTFFMLLAVLDVHNPRTKFMDGVKAIDWFGSLSILAVTLMLLLGLDFGGETFPWNSPKVICLIVFGSATIVLFVFSEKRLARYPLMPLGLFRQRTNVATLLVTACHGMVFIGGEYYLPLYLQSTHSAGPLRSGLLIMPYIITEALGGIVCGILTHQFSVYRELIIMGCVLMTLGTGLYISLGATSSISKIIGFELIAGTGCGLLFQPVIIAVQAFTKQEDIATATATLGFVRNIATSLGIVIGGIVFQNSMAGRASSLRAAKLSPDVLVRFSGADAAANVGIVGTISDPMQRLAVKEAYAWSIRNMWIFYACVGAVAAVASVYVKRAHLSEEHVETRTGLLEEKKREETHELRVVE